ncbi:MFS transporter [Brachybacterium sp. J144]|uniref:MFS transporter n=1 Tax=Brachybacterium sp. J144 TaxID=3116487 RepID=UPI002E7700B2|nr:MFS transporter [Brachybacterium sp. J144]MEE1650273.1 MFS transporter [Brachybacterium sp. J144]
MSTTGTSRDRRVADGEEHYSAATRSATAKALKRLLPFLLLMYVIAFIDRTNIGFAEESLEIHAGLSTAAYAFGAGLFFIGYAVFEVPSNLIMHRVGARWWMARIMITWGIVAALFMFTTGPTMFYILRFLLGVAEAGFFPGVILYLTYWFPRRRRAQATALFYMGLPIANILGGPLSGGLMELDGFLGLWGFQWMFLIEGLIAVVVGVIAFFYLTDRPAKARWLTEQERTELQSTLDAEAAEKGEAQHLSWWRALLNGRILYFCAVYFTIQLSVYGLTFFLPRQIAGIAGRDVGLIVGLLFAIPWIVGLVANFFSGRLADRSGNYRDIATGLLVVSAIGLTITGVLSSPVLVMIGLCLAAVGFCSAQPIFWNIPTSYLSGAALASSIGLINGIGNLGGFLAPNLRVWVVETFGTESAGLLMLAAMPLIGALLLAGTRLFDRRGAAA